MFNINDVPMVEVLLSYFSTYGAWRKAVPTYLSAYGQPKVLRLMHGLPNFPRYGPSAHRSSTKNTSHELQLPEDNKDQIYNEGTVQI